MIPVRLLLIMMCVLLLVGCGKKGPVRPLI